MRDYGKIAPQFWTGTTGRALRKERDAQTVALYLMTSPHATMLGIFQCPVAYIAHETGLPSEGASKGLQKLVELGFCSVDIEADLIWVHEMAHFQLGESLKPKDNRVAWLNREFRTLPASPLISAFLARYGEAYCLMIDAVGGPSKSPSERGLERPSPSQKKRKQEQKKEEAAPPPAGGEARPPGPQSAQSPASSGSGGSSKPARAPAAGECVDDAVKRAEAEEVLADHLASDEDRFWAMKFRAVDAGLNWNFVVKVGRKAGDYSTALRALNKALTVRDPTSYLGRVLSSIEREIEDAAPSRPRNGSKSKFPPAIQEWDDDGYPVRSDGPNRWIIAGQIYDDTGDLIGW